MTNQNAARILTALAAQDPAYETLDPAYEAALADADAPEDFAENTLTLLRTDPALAAKIDQYERNLSRVQTFGLDAVGSAVLLAAALIMLLRPNVQFKTEWDFKHFKGALKINTAAVDEKLLKPVFSVLSAAAKKASESLASVAKAMDGQEEKKEASQNAK